MQSVKTLSNWYYWAMLKNILVADIPSYWPKSRPKSVGWPLLEQNKNVPPY